MELIEVTTDIADALVDIDTSGVPHKNFLPGVGPYGEPQLTKLIVQYLNTLPKYKGRVITRRTPDLFIPQEWAIELVGQAGGLQTLITDFIAHAPFGAAFIGGFYLGLQKG